MGEVQRIKFSQKLFFPLRNVEPKRQRLRESTQTLEKVNAELALTKAELQKVVDRLSELEEKFNNAVAEKDRLTNQVIISRIKFYIFSILAKILV